MENEKTVTLIAEFRDTLHNTEISPAFEFEVTETFPEDFTEDLILFTVNEGTRCADFVVDRPKKFQSKVHETIFKQFCDDLESKCQELENGLRIGPCLCGYLEFKIKLG